MSKITVTLEFDSAWQASRIMDLYQFEQYSSCGEFDSASYSALPEALWVLLQGLTDHVSSRWFSEHNFDCPGDLAEWGLVAGGCRALAVALGKQLEKIDA